MEVPGVARLRYILGARGKPGSDRYWEPGESPAWGIYGSPGRNPPRIVLASPEEARLGCLCYSPGEAGRNHSGSSPIWTRCVDAIPEVKLYVLLLM